MNDDEILVGLEEIRLFVRRGRRTVLKMLQTGELPSKMVHGAYMTTKTRILDWLNDVEPGDDDPKKTTRELNRQ